MLSLHHFAYISRCCSKLAALIFFSHFFTTLVGPSEKLHTRKNFVFFFQKMFWLFICARIIIFTCWKLNHDAREFFLNFILFILFYEYPARLYDASLKLWMNEINLIKFRSFNIIFSSPHRRSDWVSPSTLFFFLLRTKLKAANRQQNMRVKHARLCFIPSISSHTQPFARSCEQEKVTQPQPHLLDFTVSAAVAAASLSAREQLALTLAANLSLTVLSGCVCNQLTLFFRVR